MFDKLMTISEAAKMLGVSASTLRRMEKGGIVEGYGVKVIYTPGGQRRYIFDEIKHLYAQQGFSGRLGFGKKPAILIRDLTKAFTNSNSKLSIDHHQVIDSALLIIRSAKKYNIPVVFSKTIYIEDDEFSNLWGRKFPSLKILEKESEWTKVHDSLLGETFDLMNNTVYINDFFNSPVNDFLKEKNIDTVILIGTTTSGSIRSTAIEAFQHGYRVAIPEEAVGDRNQSIQNATLIDLNARYADIINIDETIKYFKSI
ncbi:isochorismatase family protein [Salipaludibacillus sp. CF4.18]|uniref:isochorismatase family protein n=1 Tax=Salipaludibacillus sp. CF4.18 TaxID=3373081 RepID=UPI003EE59215